MKKYDFFTPIELAKAVLEITPIEKVDSIVDICCGSYNLLKAGKEKYPSARIVGVDIEKKETEEKLDEIDFHNMDGREFALNEFEKGNTYDLILSNPPFGTIDNSERYYSKDNVENKYFYLLRNRYESEFVLANLLLSNDNSTLMFILPYTFVAGESFLNIRIQMAIDYSIIQVIELPNNTFEKGDIKTFVVTIQKKKFKNSSTNIYKASNGLKGWIIKKNKSIEIEKVQKGDWGFNIKESKNNIEVFRGNISSNCFSKQGKKVLHCSTVRNGKWSPSIRYFDENRITQKERVIARKGDIIVNRIGKSAGCWCINEIDNVNITDCLFLIKKPSEEIIDLMKKNSNSDGRLNIPLRGVSTRYITSKDVKKIVSK